MPAGARRDPAAEGGEFEALRIVPDGEAMRPQRCLDRGPANAALDARGTARHVDLEHAVEAAHVEADCAGIGVADRGLDAAYDRGTAAERNDGDPGAARPVEHGRHLGLVGRQGDEIRGVLEVARKGAHGFRVGFAIVCRSRS